MATVPPHDEDMKRQIKGTAGWGKDGGGARSVGTSSGSKGNLCRDAVAKEHNVAKLQTWESEAKWGFGTRIRP